MIDVFPKKRTQLGNDSVHKFIKLIRVSSWLSNLWVITWGNLSYFMTNKNFCFQDPVTGIFNLHFLFHKTISNYVTNSILRITTSTLEQLIFIINHFIVVSFEFLQKISMKQLFNAAAISPDFPDSKAIFQKENQIWISTSRVFPFIQAQVPTHCLGDTGAFFLA